MKLRLLSIALPLLAGVTIIGTGFSIFYFVQSGEGSQAKAEASVHTETYAQLGNLSLESKYNDESKSFSLVADSTIDGGINLFYGDKQIEGNDINLTYDLTLSSTNSNTTFNKSPKITMTLTVPEDIDEYVAFGLSDGKAFDTTSSPYTYSETLSFNSGSNNIDMPAFTFEYESGKEPTNSNEYDSMVSSFQNGGSISINYVLEWVDNQ